MLELLKNSAAWKAIQAFATRKPVITSSKVMAGLVVAGIIAKGAAVIYIHNELGLGISFAGDEQFKWQVGVNAIAGGPCGGVMVAKQWVLTAAHCLKNGSGEVSTNQVKIIAGTRLLIGSDQLPIERKVVHEKFVFSASAPVKNDLALIKLAAVPDKTTVIKFSTDDSPLSHIMYMAGWACFPDENKQVADLLQFLSDCGNRLGYTVVCKEGAQNCARTPTDWFICAGRPDVTGIPGFDLGDSGGGLTNSVEGEATLVGIANYDPRLMSGCQTYANVAFGDYLKWIRDRICVGVQRGDEKNCPPDFVPEVTATVRTQS